MTLCGSPQTEPVGTKHNANIRENYTPKKTAGKYNDRI